MTADDVMFWFEDLYSIKEIYPGTTPEMSINGEPGTVVKIDGVTVEARFPEPYPMFVDVLAGFTRPAAATRSAAPSGAASWAALRRPTT